MVTIKMALWWISTSSWLKKVWAWCKKNWKIFVGMAIPIIIMLISRNGVDLKKVLDRTREDYDKEIKAIEDSKIKELEKRDASRRQYFSTVDEIKKRYEERRSELEDSKVQEVEELLQKYADDPKALTEKIRSLTGFSIYNNE